MPKPDLTLKAAAAVAKFQKEGPFTFNELLRVAKLCARTNDVRVQLSEVLFRFSDSELERFIKAGQENAGVCTRRMYQKLIIGVGMNEIFYLNLTRFTDSQLALIERSVDNMQFEHLVEAAKFTRLTSPERRTLLGLVKLSQTDSSWVNALD